MDTLNYILDNLLPSIHDYFVPGLYPKMPIEIANFGRNQLADMFDNLDFKRGAEIGVEKGEYSEILLKANPDLELFSIDAWEAHKGYRDHTNQIKLDTFYEMTKDKLSKFLNRSVIIKSYSMEAVKQFEDESLDFVYIDADHSFITSANDVYEWSKKVRKGGIVSGHDYIKMDHIHVQTMLDAYTQAYKIRPWFVLGREEKAYEEEIRDDSRSWMFVKQ